MSNTYPRDAAQEPSGLIAGQRGVWTINWNDELIGILVTVVEVRHWRGGERCLIQTDTGSQVLVLSKSVRPIDLTPNLALGTEASAAR